MINDYLDRQRVCCFARVNKLPITRLCKLVLIEVEYSNTSSGWKTLKLVINNIALDHFIRNTFKTFFGSFVRKREFDCVNKKV